MRRARLVMVLFTLLLSTCTPVSDSSWFIITGVTEPGESSPAGVLTAYIMDDEPLTADIHLVNKGFAPGSTDGTGIRLTSLSVDYDLPATFAMPGFDAAINGYLAPASSDSDSSLVVAGVVLLSYDQILYLRDQTNRPANQSPFSIQVAIRIEGETDTGGKVETSAGTTINVMIGNSWEESPTPTPTASPTPTTSPTPTPTPTP